MPDGLPEGEIRVHVPQLSWQWPGTCSPALSVKPTMYCTFFSHSPCTTATKSCWDRFEKFSLAWHADGWSASIGILALVNERRCMSHACFAMSRQISLQHVPNPSNTSFVVVFAASAGRSTQVATLPMCDCCLGCQSDKLQAAQGLQGQAADV